MVARVWLKIGEDDCTECNRNIQFNIDAAVEALSMRVPFNLNCVMVVYSGWYETGKEIERERKK